MLAAYANADAMALRGEISAEEPLEAPRTSVRHP